MSLLTRLVRFKLRHVPLDPPWAAGDLGVSNLDRADRIDWGYLPTEPPLPMPEERGGRRG